MPMKKVRNYGQSVRMRLLNLSRQTGIPYNTIVLRYLHERLLYRLSQSALKPHFILKGSSLLYATQGVMSRPTKDIDFLGWHISRTPEHIRAAFSSILSIECMEDAVRFDINSLDVSEITVNREYHGAHVRVDAHIDTMVVPMEMDIGFGDVITPHACELDYPLALPNLPPVQILAYSLETVVAEKFESMFALDAINSRMKDFYDVYTLLHSEKLDEKTLAKAIGCTFANRKTVIQPSAALLSPDFYTDKERLSQWKNFLHRIKCHEALDFEMVCHHICRTLLPILHSGGT